jgi:RNA binding exosome subunit
MIEKIEITVDVIIHATEDISKLFQSFEEVLGIKEDDFTVEETVGHYENPITMLNTKIVKRQAQEFIHKLMKSFSKEQNNQLIEEIEERTIDSRFHIRLDKQELIKGTPMVREKGTIQLKIFTPIYNKKDTVKIFTKIFQIAN